MEFQPTMHRLLYLSLGQDPAGSLQPLGGPTKNEGQLFMRVFVLLAFEDKVEANIGIILD